MSFRRRLLLSVVLILLVPVVLIVVLFGTLSRESRDARTDARINGAFPAVVSEYRAAVEAADRAAADLGRDAAFGAALSASPGTRPGRVRGLFDQRGLAWIEVSGNGAGRISFGGSPFALAETRVRTPGGLFTLRVSVREAAGFRRSVADLIDLPVVVGKGPTATAPDPAVPRDILDLEEPPPQTIAVDGPAGEYRARVFELLGEGGRPTRIAIAAPLGESVLAGNGALIAASIVAFLAMAALSAVFLLRGLGREHEGIVELALTDGLTGLANHRHFQETMAREVERSERYKHDLSVLLMDLDNFKSVNDTYGHPQGDEVLRRVADVLRQESRNIDRPARYGGEEFAILLPETDAAGAAEFGERIRSRMADTRIDVDGAADPLVMSGSIGVAGTPDFPLSTNGMIEAADRALYEAKRAGKDRVVRATAETGASASREADRSA